MSRRLLTCRPTMTRCFDLTEPDPAVIFAFNLIDPTAAGYLFLLVFARGTVRPTLAELPPWIHQTDST